VAQLQIKSRVFIHFLPIKIQKMTDEKKINRFKTFLRIWGAATIIVMSINWTAFIFKFQSFNPGGFWHWLIWDDVYGHVGPMIFVIYIVWGVYLLIVARNPLKLENTVFYDFSIWANLVHGFVMIPMALSASMYHARLLTDIPFILMYSLGIYLWRPDRKIKVQST
jgi:hypothetical protein